jgi:hypothetical protein
MFLPLSFPEESKCLEWACLDSKNGYQEPDSNLDKIVFTKHRIEQTVWHRLILMVVAQRARVIGLAALLRRAFSGLCSNIQR